MMAAGPANMMEIVQRKQFEVQQLYKTHADNTDPLQTRMRYMSSNYTLQTSSRLRRQGEILRLSVSYDLKRFSPTTVPHTVVGYGDAGQVARTLADCGVDAIFVNTDFNSYGGDIADLKNVVQAVSGMPEETRPSVLMKDIVIDPIQVAQAAEAGADGVYLIAGICGPRLEDLLDACTVMGMEAVVEVHTPNEAKYAHSLGATIFALTNWDRTDGSFNPGHAVKLRNFLPDGIGAVCVATGGLFTSDKMAPADEAMLYGDSGFDGVVAGRGMARWKDITAIVRAIRGQEGLPRTQLGLVPPGAELDMEEEPAE